VLNSEIQIPHSSREAKGVLLGPLAQPKCIHRGLAEDGFSSRYAHIFCTFFQDLPFMKCLVGALLWRWREIVSPNVPSHVYLIKDADFKMLLWSAFALPAKYKLTTGLDSSTFWKKKIATLAKKLLQNWGGRFADIDAFALFDTTLLHEVVLTPFQILFIRVLLLTSLP
jgi:hypothetical protein